MIDHSRKRPNLIKYINAQIMWNFIPQILHGIKTDIPYKSDIQYKNHYNIVIPSVDMMLGHRLRQC